MAVARLMRHDWVTPDRQPAMSRQQGEHPVLKLNRSIDRLETETAFSVLARANELQGEGRDIINLGIGQPDFATPEHIVEAAIKALRDGHHGYTPAEGIPALREAVAADLHKRHDVEVNPDSVIIMPGGKPTMFFAMLIFGQPGAEIIYPDPGFPIYRSMIAYSGATPIAMSLREQNGFSFTAEDVLSQITPRTSMIILNSPGNPTGGITSKVELERLVAGLAEHPQVAILSDEIYSRMLYDGNRHLSLLQFSELRDRLIMLDGWSKTYAMTGWRLGYGVWPDALVETVTRLAINSHSCVNAPTQYAGIAALNGRQDVVDTMVAAFDERRRIIIPLLNDLHGVTCINPDGAFYAFPNISGTGFSAQELQIRLLEETGVATIAGTSFGPSGEGYIRFSYANSNALIKQAMSRIDEWLTSVQG